MTSSFPGLYDGLKNLNTDDKSKNKRPLDSQPTLIPRSKRVHHNPVAKPTLKKVVKPAPVLTLKDSSGHELSVDMESYADINVMLQEFEDPYDPSIPNEYEEYTKKKIHTEMLQKEQARLSELVFHQQLLQQQQPQQVQVQGQGGDTPQPVPTEDAAPPTKKESFAELMMKKMGWKGEGHGLGKKQQGMASALIVHKIGDQQGVIVNTAALELEKNSINPTGTPPSRVIVLHNLVGPGELDEHVCPETTTECENYGVVLNCQAHESATEKNPDEVVKVYVKFKYQEQALKALMDIDGRYFAGREVRADYYNELAFDRADFRLL